MTALDVAYMMPSLMGIALSNIALLTERLKIFENSLAAIGPGFDVIDVQHYPWHICRRPSTSETFKLIASHNQKTKPPIDLSSGVVFASVGRCFDNFECS